MMLAALSLSILMGSAPPQASAGAPTGRIEALEQQIRLQPRLTQPYIELAREYARSGDPMRAEATLRRGLAESWEPKTMRGALVEFLAMASRWNDAVTEATPLAVDSAGRILIARLRVNAGIEAYHAHDRVRAREHWERALVAEPSLLEASVNLAALLVEMNRKDSARVVVQRALVQHPTEPRLLMLRARTLEGPASLEAAVKAMQQARKNDPTDESLGLQLASILEGTGNHLPAMALYDTLVRSPTATEKTFKAAVAFWLEASEPKMAVTVAELGIGKYPRESELYASLGEARALQFNWQASADAYRKAIPLSSEREPLELALLDVYISGADTAGMLALARALSIRPASRATLLRAAQAVTPIRAADAASIYDGMLARDADDVDALEAGAALAESVGDTARAIAFASRATYADSSGPAPPLILLRLTHPSPDTAQLLLRRALWRGVGRLQALELSTASQMSGGLNLRAISRAKPKLTEKQKVQEQLRWTLDTVVLHTSWGRGELTQLRLAYPQSGILERYTAMIAMREGSDSAALATYDRVLRRNPGDVDAQLQRAALLQRMGRTAEAVDGYARAYDADPANDSTFVTLRTLRQQQGTLPDLLTQLRRLRARLPDSKPLALHEVEVLQRLGRLDEANKAAAVADTLGGKKKP
jgi:tetratricopeptide (TPR) repeat protein